MKHSELVNSWVSDVKKEWKDDPELESHNNDVYLYLPSKALAKDNEAAQIAFYEDGDIFFSIVEPPYYKYSVEKDVTEFQQVKSEVDKWNQKKAIAIN